MLPTIHSGAHASWVANRAKSVHGQPLAPLRPSLGRVVMGTRYRNDPYLTTGNAAAMAAPSSQQEWDWAPSVASSSHQGPNAGKPMRRTPSAEDLAPPTRPLPDLDALPANRSADEAASVETLLPFRGAALAPILRPVIPAAVPDRVAAVVMTVIVKFRVFSERHAVSEATCEGEWRGKAPVEGELVVVQGDRGEDVGSIERVESLESLPLQSGTGLAKLPRVLRKADTTEVSHYYEARAREDEALVLAQACAARARVNVPLAITAVEYQADFQKLSLVFRVMSRHPLRRAYHQRVDFRDLQRELFRCFKCRIWLVNELELHGQTEAVAGPGA